MGLDEGIWGYLADKEEGSSRALRQCDNHSEVSQKSKYQPSTLRMRGQLGSRRTKSARAFDASLPEREKCFKIKGRLSCVYATERSMRTAKLTLAQEVVSVLFFQLSIESMPSPALSRMDI